MGLYGLHTGLYLPGCPERCVLCAGAGSTREACRIAESTASEDTAQLRAQRFLAGRVAVDVSAAQAMDDARAQHTALQRSRRSRYHERSFLVLRCHLASRVSIQYGSR